MGDEKKKRKLHLGVTYNPEQWPIERWSDDIRLMKSAGLTIVRLGEFAWPRYELRTNEFDLDWMEHVINLLAEEGIDCVLVTPTAKPPSWLFKARPEIIAVNENGERSFYEHRSNYCVNSSGLHEAVQNIVTVLAERFGNLAQVVGWQIGTKFNGECYCHTCQQLFQAYLEKEYQSLERLNQRWSISRQGSGYLSWDDIPLPNTSQHPSVLLEFRRFVTRSYRKYQQLQTDILRNYIADSAWITLSSMDWNSTLDQYVLSDGIDFASWSNYQGSGNQDYLESGSAHDMVRGLKRKNFWVMQTQSGSANWAPINSTLDKGKSRAKAWQAVGRGAEAVIFGQWRSSLGGQDQFQSTLIDQAGQPRLIYSEVDKLSREFAKTGHLWAGLEPTSKVAILHDYECGWSIGWQPHHESFNYADHLKKYYRPLVSRNIPVDIIRPEADLSGYRLVIAPALILSSELRAEHLSQYVRKGGRLILTPQTGMKDRYNVLLPMRQPGPFGELAGVEVEEYFALDQSIPVKGNWFSGTAMLWAERLKLIEGTNTQHVAKYGEANGWLDEQVAISVHVLPRGYGMTYYVGADLDERSLGEFLTRICNMAKIQPVLNSPSGVEIIQRIQPEGGQVGMGINHTSSPRTLNLPFPIYDFLSEKTYQDEFILKPYDVVIFTRVEMDNIVRLDDDE